jgi:hypothetical protein
MSYGLQLLCTAQGHSSCLIERAIRQIDKAPGSPNDDSLRPVQKKSITLTDQLIYRSSDQATFLEKKKHGRQFSK